MIKINHIPQIECDLYDPDGNLVGVIKSEYSWNDVRIQIKEHNLLGYYVMFNGHKIDILPDGRCLTWPEGFYDVIDKQLEQIFVNL